MSRVAPLCVLCRHKTIGQGSEGQGTCMAFPDGIPSAIWDCENLHLEAFPGDQGLRFEARQGREADAAAAIAFLGQLAEPEAEDEEAQPPGTPPDWPPIVSD